MAEGLTHLNDSVFGAQVLSSGEPVLVDFWASWCEPCKRMEPMLTELAVHYGTRLKIAKLNVEENPHTARQYMVRGLPHFIIFKNGQVQSAQTGAVSKSQMMQFIDKAI
jgi:thioredoxin 1